MDPFLYKYTKFVFNRNGIYGEIIGKNITLFGLSITRFLDVRPHFLDDVSRLEIDVQIPRAFIHGYATGEINLLGIRGAGTGTNIKETQCNLRKMQYGERKIN